MERIQLRDISMLDAVDLLEIFSNPNSTKYWLSECYSQEEVERMMRYEYLSYRQRGLMCPWVLVLNQKVIGICNFNDEFDGVGRIGFILNEQYERQGFMHQALNELIHVGFTELGYHRIEALVFMQNEKSKKCLERLGFVCEGVMRSYLKHHDHYEDILLMSLLKEEERYEERIIDKV